MNLFEKKYSIYRRLVLIVILLTILVYSFTGEKLPFSDGLGWDGKDYYSILQNFSEIYFNHGINAYHIQRILPFAILHYVYALFDIAVTPQSAVIGCSILNFICVLLTVLFFFKISRNRNWAPQTETIAFAICFFNVPVLKVFGYYSLLTDCPAYLLSYMAIYYFLKDNKLMEVIVGILAMVTWPILSLVIWILAFFPREGVKELNKDDRPSKMMSILVRTVLTLWLPMLFIAISAKMVYLHPDLPFLEWFKHRHPLNFVHACICILSTAILLFMASKVFELDWKNIFATIFKKRNIFILLTSFLGFVFAYMASKYYGGKGSFTLYKELIILQELTASDFLIILEAPFLYLGLFVLLIIFLWKEYAKEVCEKYGIGFLFAMMLGFIFITDIETRKLTSFYPIFLIPLMGVIGRLKFKNWVPIAFVLVSLVLSFFWWKINVPGIEESFIARIDNYRAFPAQRYFMFQAPWQCRMVYMIVLTIEVTIGAIIILMHKKGFLYSKEKK